MATATAGNDRATQALDGLRAATDALDDVSLDTLDEGVLARVAGECEQVARRVTARRTQAAAALASRRASQAAVERPDDGRAPQRAVRDVQRELASDLQISPSQAKGMLATGRRLESMPATAEAFTAGRITSRHVDLMFSTLAPFLDRRRERLEAQLLEAAVVQDPVAFGKTCRALLAVEEPDEAMRQLDRQYGRRRAAVTVTPDGTTRLSAEGPGMDGEILHTAIDAFRRPDAADEHRTAEQRTWDAMIDMASAALRAGEAPTNHGVRPHVSVMITDQVLRDQRGVGQATYTGPMPYDELCRMLGDATVAAILANAKFIPTWVSGTVRTVPRALWRALQQRDRTCVWPGCDMPARWCDVAHAFLPFNKGGKLSLDEAMLLCRRHHRRYDRGGYRARWVDDLPTIERLDGRPMATFGPDNRPDRAPPDGASPGRAAPERASPEVAGPAPEPPAQPPTSTSPTPAPADGTPPVPQPRLSLDDQGG